MDNGLVKMALLLSQTKRQLHLEPCALLFHNLDKLKLHHQHMVCEVLYLHLYLLLLFRLILFLNQLIQHDQENQVTSLIVILSFMIVFDKFVISGTISQVNHIDGRIVNEPSELNQEEVETLARPCLNMLNRLTYEVTEIALDLPGINLEF